MKVLFILLWFVIFTLIWIYLHPIVTVCGESMSPTYYDGEVLLSKRVFIPSKVMVGDVVVLKAPYEKTKYIFKRVQDIKVTRDGIMKVFVVGDNKKNSYDSRDYGYIDANNIVSIVYNQRENRGE